MRTEGSEPATQIAWDVLAARLAELEPVEGGYSGATRGIVRIDGGRRVFVKVGANAYTRAWAQKEVQVYGRLEALRFEFAPALLASAPDGTGLALEALTPDAGWDWSDRWSAERLEACLAAIDHLAAVDPVCFDPSLTVPTLTAQADAWPRLDPAAPATRALYPRLEALGGPGLARLVEARGGRRSPFSARREALIHLDVRSDNCAWKAVTGEVRLVDWNWLQVGDRRIDHAAFLTTVQLSGFDVTADHSGRLDAEALIWMAGYWLNASTRPIWPGGPSALRDIQFNAAVTALQLAGRLR